jgi:hypothetical protein
MINLRDKFNRVFRTRRLTDAQLLMLDILIFFMEDDAVNFIGKSVQEIAATADEYVRSGNRPPNPKETSDEELLAVLKFILDDHHLCRLRVTHFRNDEDLRVACFVDAPISADLPIPTVPRDVNVIFCGTITAQGWIDNGIGSYESDTKAQRIASTFVDQLPPLFGKKITASGHSKGGNLSQYIGLLNPRVSRAVSFDGQGFSGEFRDKYSAEIAANSNKLTQIAAAGDPVSAIGISVCGRQRFVETVKQKNLFLYHKPNLLLGESGKLRPSHRGNHSVKRTDSAAYLNEISNYLETLPKPRRKKLANSMVTAMKVLFDTKDGSEGFTALLSPFPDFAAVIAEMELKKRRSRPQ